MSNAQPWQHSVHRMATNIRHRVLEHTIRNDGGYLSQACSAAELFAYSISAFCAWDRSASHP